MPPGFEMDFETDMTFPQLLEIGRNRDRTEATPF
jgi:hypothetical protein